MTRHRNWATLRIVRSRPVRGKLENWLVSHGGYTIWAVLSDLFRVINVETNKDGKKWMMSSIVSEWCRISSM